MDSPRDLTYNMTHILVADSGNHRIQIFSTNGQFLQAFGTFGSNNDQLFSPGGITINSSHIFVSDANSRVQIVGYHFVEGLTSTMTETIDHTFTSTQTVNQTVSVPGTGTHSVNITNSITTTQTTVVTETSVFSSAKSEAGNNYFIFTLVLSFLSIYRLRQKIKSGRIQSDKN